MLAAIVCGTLTGARGYKAIAQWARAQHATIGPWLGFQRDANVALYDAEQAEQEWNFIRQALDDHSNSTIRGLMGAELGTAIPACTRCSPARPPTKL